MKNHWLRHFRDVRKKLEESRVALFIGPHYIEAQPVAVDMEWEFTYPVHVLQIHIVHVDGVYPIPLPCGISLDRKMNIGDVLRISFKGIKMYGHDTDGKNHGYDAETLIKDSTK